MARPIIDHRARARLAYPTLRDCARRGQTITYGALTAAQGLHHRSASWFLGVIQTECSLLGLPPLQALVVNAQTGRPGRGYVASGRRGPGYKAALRRVRMFKWPKRPPF